MTFGHEQLDVDRAAIEYVGLGLSPEGRQGQRW
jgi:hypothetical protein